MNQSGTAVLLTTSFLGCLDWYRLLVQSDKVVIEQHENYQKRSIRNRAYLLGANGVQSISVPLTKGKNSQAPIKSIDIAYDHDWVGPMLHTVRSCLGAAPYFDYYYPTLEDILRAKHTKLWSLNEDLMRYILEAIGYDATAIQYTTGYQHDYTTVTDHRKIHPYPQEMNSATYSQVWEDRSGFIDNLSVLDLLFCLGPGSMPILKQRQFATDKRDRSNL